MTSKFWSSLMDKLPWKRESKLERVKEAVSPPSELALLFPRGHGKTTMLNSWSEMMQNPMVNEGHQPFNPVRDIDIPNPEYRGHGVLEPVWISLMAYMETTRLIQQGIERFSVTPRAQEGISSYIEILKHDIAAGLNLRVEQLTPEVMNPERLTRVVNEGQFEPWTTLQVLIDGVLTIELEYHTYFRICSVDGNPLIDGVFRLSSLTIFNGQTILLCEEMRTPVEQYRGIIPHPESPVIVVSSETHEIYTLIIPDGRNVYKEDVNGVHAIREFGIPSHTQNTNDYTETVASFQRALRENGLPTPKQEVKQEFVVSELITLKLESHRHNEYFYDKYKTLETNIYINGKKFQQCKYLLLDLPTTDEKIKDIDNIDDAAKNYSRELEGGSSKYIIPPETEFWGHCSNIQTWFENDYDLRILHSNLSLPLLKELANHDERAKMRLKEQLAEKVEKGGYRAWTVHRGEIMKHFTPEERDVLKGFVEFPSYHNLDLKEIFDKEDIDAVFEAEEG